jgi:hypothetical protein
MGDTFTNLPDGIYEETKFKMVFLVKGSEIHRLIWNHVKGEDSIVSREIYNTDNYMVNNNTGGDGFTLKNGLLFKKINTNKETVKSKVKQFYNENMDYLNTKFSKEIKLLQGQIQQSQPVTHPNASSIPLQVALGESGLEKPVIARCQ